MSYGNVHLLGGVGKGSFPARFGSALLLRSGLDASSLTASKSLFFVFAAGAGARLEPLAALLVSAAASPLAFPRTDFLELGGAADDEGGFERAEAGRALFVGASGSGEGAGLFLLLA
jgi:hypothetical protein